MATESSERPNAFWQLPIPLLLVAGLLAEPAFDTVHEMSGSISTELSEFASFAESVVTVLALVVGGAWAYFRFGKDRTYRPRFDMAIDAGRLPSLDSAPLLMVRLTMTNTGSGQIKLLQDHTTLRVVDHVGLRTDYDRLGWKDKGVAYRILQEHSWIESKERIQHDEVVQLPAEPPSLLLLEFQAKTEVRHFFRPKRIWVFTRKIVSTADTWKPDESNSQTANNDRRSSL